ncbi:MAG: DUF1329 domain-containing protein [Deltaproteobacteria bacterium]|nr:DUF1329 domain-containing protein [Deltaproteobacteria bacterium]
MSLHFVRTCSVFFATAFMGFVLCGTAPAGEVQYPVAAYSADELAKVREWEKTWVGKKIEKSNIDQVAQFLPDQIVQLYKDPKKWGAPEAEGLFFSITPYTQVIETTGVVTATKKYAPSVKVNAEGDIVNYADIAGVPFPSPKTGLEIAWNFDFNTHGDSNHYSRIGPVIAPGVSIERNTNQDMYELYWIHRTDVDPVPAYADNPKGIHRGLFLHLYDPPESQNSRFFNLRYIDKNKEDDGYMWYAPFRRIRRINVGQRTDTIDGSDMIYDDEYGWDGHIQRNTYKLIGKKDLLCSRHTDIKKFQRAPGQAAPNNITRERIATYVVEVKSKDPHYLYGKRIWYVDPETYLMLWAEMYDELQRPWKCFEYFHENFKTNKGEMKNMIAGVMLLDFQRTHASLPLHSIHEVGSEKVNKRMFTVSYLQQAY